MSLGTFLALILIFFTFAVYWIRQRYSKLEKLGFLHEKPEFPFGNAKGLGTKYHMIDILRRTYNKFGKQSPIHGMFTFFTPNFVVTDLDLVKEIMIKDFEVFHNRGLFNSKEHDPLSAHLLAIEDQEWRNMRHKLTPTFTSGKMKMMFHTVLDVSNHMLTKLRTSPSLENVEIKTLLADFTTDVVGNVAFGLEINAIKNQDSKFRQTTKKVFKAQNFFAKILFLSSFRNLARKLRLKLIPTDITEFFRGTVKETVEYRRKNNIERNDMLNLLMKIGNEGREGEEELTIDEIAAQCFIFFVAGHETSSSAATYALFILANYPELQEKLRHDIKSVLAKHDNKVTYDAMQEMKYLDMVVNETLRMFPPAPLAIRQASKNYKISNTNLEIPKNSMVFVPISVIHNDPTYYPEPDKFDPERFSDENKANRHRMAHIPFGDGPRSCIGNRFGLMQTKIALIQLLTNFKFTKTSKTPEKIPFNPKAPIVQPTVDVLLKLEKLN